MSIKHEIQKVVFQNVVDQMSEKHLAANNIPASREKAKENDQIDKAEKYIYGYDSAEVVMETMNRVAKFSGITNINQLKQKHTNAYIQSKIDQGKTKNYIVTEQYAIRKFEKCLLNTGRMSKHDRSISPDVKLPEGSKIDPIGRYSDQETKTIIDSLKSDYKEEISLGVKLQKIAGLRISELTGLKAKYIDIKGQKIHITDNTAKGGRYRAVNINKEDIGILRAITAGKDPEDKVVSVTGRWLQNVVKTVCDKNDIEGRGTHGMRGKFANDRLKQYCKKYDVKYDIDHLKDAPIEELTDMEKHVLRLVSNDLGHNRISVVREHYLQR